MVEVVLSSDNVTVLGGPSNLEVDLNIGAPGTRGSVFLIGTENPNTLNLEQGFDIRPELFDIFINVNTASEDYLQAYQLENQDGIDVWNPIFKLSQQTFSANKVIEFSDGQAETALEIASIGLDEVTFDEESNSFAFFGIQASLTNVDLDNPSNTPLPSAMSFKVGNAIFDNDGLEDPSTFPSLLPITFNAVEFDGQDWAPIDNKKTYVSLTASYVNPNEIFQNINFGGNG